MYRQLIFEHASPIFLYLSAFFLFGGLASAENLKKKKVVGKVYYLSANVSAIPEQGVGDVHGRIRPEGHI